MTAASYLRPNPSSVWFNQGMILGLSYRYYRDERGQRYAVDAVEKINREGGEEAEYALQADRRHRSA